MFDLITVVQAPVVQKMDNDIHLINHYVFAIGLGKPFRNKNFLISLSLVLILLGVQIDSVYAVNKYSSNPINLLSPRDKTDYH